MIVGRGKLRLIMLSHCKVNIKADGEILKYRYLYNPENNQRNWTCNGEVMIGMTTDITRDLFDKYKIIEVTWKSQF